jgi:hypothetical protein
MKRQMTLKAVLVASTLGLATMAAAQTAPGMGDLIGVRGSSVESEFETRGYTFAGNEGGAALWWNARTQTCISVAVNNGRVSSIQSTSASDCGHGGTKRHTASSGHASHGRPEDLVGSDSIHATDVLKEWGFRDVDTLSGDSEMWITYWKASTHECVQVTTDFSRITAVDRVDHHPRCR